MDDTAAHLLPEQIKGDETKRTLVRFTLAKIQSANRFPILRWDYLSRLLKEGSLPSAHEQGDLVTLYLGERASGPGEDVQVSFLSHGHIFGCKSPPGMRFILESLKSLGYVEGVIAVGGSGHMHLTFRGWERLRQLQNAVEDSHIAFMAMKFDRPDLDRAYNECFKGAVARTGFELRRVDEKQPAGLIDNQLRVAIRTSRFLIADLSHGSHGAYWEAGFAEGLGKPVCGFRLNPATRSDVKAAGVPI